ncbi:MAG TPA: hypothetical protein VMU41_18085 [Candidatus Binataceae bacterium]|nr:hypothetical protein [Candidatus Binataceae bacterium]
MSSRLCSVSSEAAGQAGEAGVILPCQYHDLSGGGYRLTGEQRLMLALLADAINVYQKGALSGALRARRLYADAEQWIMTDRPGLCGLAFPTVCEALGINATRLRRRLLDWKYSLRHQHGDRSALHFQTPHRERRPLAPRQISSN